MKEKKDVVDYGSDGGAENVLGYVKMRLFCNLEFEKYLCFMFTCLFFSIRGLR